MRLSIYSRSPYGFPRDDFAEKSKKKYATQGCSTTPDLYDIPLFLSNSVSNLTRVGSHI